MPHPSRLRPLATLTLVVALLVSVVGLRPAAAIAVLDTFSINDVPLAEGNSGTTAFTFTISRSAGSGPATLPYSTSDGTATAPGDYQATTGTATFAAGQTSTTVTINVVGDAADEIDETFVVTLTPGATSTCLNNDCTGQGTILNDDGPAIVISNVNLAEGNSGEADAVFSVELTQPSTHVVSVGYATQDGTATIGDNDYDAAAGTLTFPAGTTSQTVTVKINGDTKDETNETFAVVLTNNINARIADSQGDGRIDNDDTAPTVSVGDLLTAETAGTAQVPVTLSAISGKTITVKYSTADGTATAGSDYTAVANGTVTFLPGSDTASAPVTIANDTANEPEETFTVTLSAPANATLGAGSSTVSITDNDTAPVVSITDAAPVTEGDTGTTAQTFTVTLSAASGRTITVHYATADDTAVAGQDYTAASGDLTFAPGDTSETVTVAVIGDTRNEATPERYLVNLTAPSQATLGTSQGAGSITDNDASPTLTIGDVTHAEGNSGTTLYSFPVTLSAASGRTVTVQYGTADGTATAPSDYTASSGTLTFAPGETAKSVDVVVSGDTGHEATENFTVVLSGSVNAGITKSTGTGTVTNDDAGPDITINDVAVSEGDSGTVIALFTVTLSTSSATTITVDYATADGTAAQPADYTTNSGTLTFAPGVLTQSVLVTVKGDTLPETDEQFTLHLANPTGGGQIVDADGIGTITNDDGPPPSLAIADVTQAEGNAGTTTFTFTVTKTGTTTGTVTVDYATAAGTATTPADFAATNGTLTFGPAETTQTFTVAVVGDTTHEPTETFTVNLTNARNAAIGRGAATGTITNDDAVPTLSVNDVTLAEGNSGTKAYTFTISLSNPRSSDVTVDVATALGTAQAGDLTAVPTTTLTIPAGQLSTTQTVAVVGDTTDENDETFFLNLSNPVGATVADAQGVGTITNDDTAPALAITSPTVAEGDTGTTDVVFTVSLSAASGKTVTVTATTADGTATEPSDYAAKTELLTFAAGETVKTFTVAAKGDSTKEGDETFTVALSGATNVSATGGPATATLTNDDAVPSISIDDVTVTEGNSGTSTATVTVSLSNPSSTAITVDAATADGTASSADYTPVGTTTLTFAPGDTAKTIDVTIKGDTIDEANETVFVNLTNPAGATVTDAQGKVTITDDDSLPAIAVDDLTVTEGDSGTSTATLTVSLSNPSSTAITVDAATADGTATSADYTPVATTTLTFAPGDTTKTIDVTIKGDTIDEANETVFVNLTNPAGATITDAQGKVTITDDDGLPSLTVDDVTVTEGNSGTVGATFRVTLSPSSGRSAKVDYTTNNGTATGDDYTAASGTLTFLAGETTKTVTVDVKGDTVDEGTESFTLVLTSPVNASVADGSGTATITDDDQAATPPPAPAQGYSLVGEDGSLYAYGTAKNVGDMKGKTLNAPVIGVAYTPGGNGYWLVAKDGGIFTFGDADFYGSMGGTKLNSPVIGMAATPSGKGYWLFAGDGGIFTFGDATFFGSMGDKKLNAPVINMEPLQSGNGYWLVAADGGIFTFGSAEFFGSMGDKKINQPVFDMTSTDTDGGYWLVARDGGIFSFGDAEPKFYGSAVNETPRPTKVIGMDSTPGSLGYWIADANGKVYAYGNAQPLGDRYQANNPAPMIGFASVPS